MPALAKKRFCDVQYAVSKPAAWAYSQSSGAWCSAWRDAVGERPLQSTASDTAVVESSARICEKPKRSGRSALVNGVVAHSGPGTLHASVARTLSVTTKRTLRPWPAGGDGGDGQGMPRPGWARVDQVVVPPAGARQAAHRREVEHVGRGRLLAAPGGAEAEDRGEQRDGRDVEGHARTGRRDGRDPLDRTGQSAARPWAARARGGSRGGRLQSCWPTLGSIEVPTSTALGFMYAWYRAKK